jgi:hypothetical protein
MKDRSNHSTDIRISGGKQIYPQIIPVYTDLSTDSTVLSTDGRGLARIFLVMRLTALTTQAMFGFRSSEDKRFWTHPQGGCRQISRIGWIFLFGFQVIVLGCSA